MATNTAIRATNTQAITFKNLKHKDFYPDECNYMDWEDLYAEN